MEQLTEIREGWHWPKDDVRCWRCFQRQKDLPEKVMEFVPEKNVCVQAGGNVGVYVKNFAEKFDKVFTFEPEPLNFFCMRENLKDCDNVIAHEGFVGDKNEISKNIVRYDTEKDPNTGKFRIGEQPGNIPVFAIDDLDLNQCDLIQLDVEGNEHDALKGAVDTIRKFKPVICLEWFENQKILADFLEVLNYKLVADFRSDRVFISN